ncbi:MAG: hypothetical protein RL701_699 [Pseudomonadota bacterium]
MAAHAESQPAAISGNERAEHEAEAEAEETEPPVSLGVDTVVGFGKLPVVTDAQTLAVSPIATESFVFALGYDLNKSFGLSLHVPLGVGQIDPPRGAARSAIALGNLELEGEYGLQLAAALRLTFALGVSLPTAQGDETPHELESEAVAQSERRRYDRGAILFAAAAARGFEDEAQFEVDRFGIVPKVRLDYRHGRLLVRPYMTMENLFDTGSEKRPPLIELLVGSYVGVLLCNEHLELGARVWTDLALSGGGETVGVVEPRVTAHFDSLTVTLGGIWPFAGDLTDPQFGGVRLQLGLRI